MANVTTLLDTHTSLTDRTNAATNIITQYDLHFSASDILKAFDNLRNIANLVTMRRMMLITLTTNLRIFIAIVYASIDNKMITGWQYYMMSWRSCCATLGYTWTFNGDDTGIALKVWSKLHDYYEFDITKLTLSDDLRAGLQEHINSKQPRIKGAIKK